MRILNQNRCFKFHRFWQLADRFCFHQLFQFVSRDINFALSRFNVTLGAATPQAREESDALLPDDLDQVERGNARRLEQSGD